MLTLWTHRSSRLRIRTTRPRLGALTKRVHPSLYLRGLPLPELLAKRRRGHWAPGALRRTGGRSPPKIAQRTGGAGHCYYQRSSIWADAAAHCALSGRRRHDCGRYRSSPVEMPMPEAHARLIADEILNQGGHLLALTRGGQAAHKGNFCRARTHWRQRWRSGGCNRGSDQERHPAHHGFCRSTQHTALRTGPITQPNVIYD